MRPHTSTTPVTTPTAKPKTKPKAATATKTLLATLAAATLVFGLSACDQIPSLSAADNAANKSACEAITGPIGEVTSKLTAGDFPGLATAAATIPAQVDTALTHVTDGPLIKRL